MKSTKKQRILPLFLFAILLLGFNSNGFASSNAQISFSKVTQTIPSFTEIKYDLKERFENNIKLRTANQFSNTNIRTSFLNQDIEISETDTHMIYKLTVPKVHQGKIKVSIKQNGVIIIKNLRSSPTEKLTPSELIKQRRYSHYKRVIRLPRTTTLEGITPIEKNGILEIQVRKI